MGVTTPATYGGPGWRARRATHLDEIGSLWTACGVRSEVDRLRAVLLARPPDSLGGEEDLDERLLMAPVDVPGMRVQCEMLANIFESLEIYCYQVGSQEDVPPNIVFMRDLFFMTPEGAVVGRTASQARAGEERHAAAALAAVGVPILMTMRGSATFEGADALWVNPSLVMVGCGVRTNTEGYEAVSGLLASLDVRSVAVALPQGVQHLLGVVNFVDYDLAVIRADRITDEIRDALRDHRLLVLDATREVTRGLAMNFVTLSPRRILMPAGCPQTREIYEKAGLECLEADVSEYVNAAGALGCLTGILQRA
ncbi:MAG: amidinotransferase [Armatimonadetes bacterium]|nr:amidinotransferase [Armatimonadota bacterium]